MHTKLRNMRKINNLSTKEMSKLLKISKSFYSQIENENRRLTYEMAVKISKIFNKKPDDLFYEDYNNMV